MQSVFGIIYKWLTKILFYQVFLTKIKKLIKQYYFSKYDEQPYVMYIHFCFFICHFWLSSAVNQHSMCEM